MRRFFSLFRIERKDLTPLFRRGGHADRLFPLFVILLALFGTAMVFSAGGPYAAFRYGDGAYFAKRQIVWLALGGAVCFAASRIRADVYVALAPYFYIFSLFLLVLVLITGFVGNGAKRWLSIGPVTVQPSEILKLTLVMMLARYYAAYEDDALSQKSRKNIFLYGTLIPGLILVVPVILVMLQKHLSCIIILGTIGILMMLAAGIHTRYLRMATAAGAVGVTFLALFTDYTKERITVWQNPEAYKLTGGWQTLQGLMAIGSGGLFGLGYGRSMLKYCYVSEPANDMIFAILCEELGFVGAAAALLLFALLIGRGCTIAVGAKNTAQRLIAFGISAKIAVQVLLNVAVVTNTIPNTGISLPFFSYGGSSLVMLFFEMGMILSISAEAKIGQ